MSHITKIQKLEREKYKELKALTNDYELVNIGPSKTNEKRITLVIPGAKVVPRLNAQGTYNVTMDGYVLVVVRVDKNEGWRENLNVIVYTNGEEIDAKIAEIEELAEMRMTLYKQVTKMNEGNDKIDKMEEELNYARKQLQAKYVSSSDNIRQAQINTYYDNQYQAYTDILRYSLLFVVILVGVGFIYRLDIISPRFLQPIIWTIIALGIIVLGNKMRDISRRDNMDYATYVTPGNVAQQMNATSDVGNQSSTSNESSMCRGKECCADGQRYDFIRNVCEKMV